uniref:Uncharacterized protein n=1 Tax=Anguilla anguilla TaxID=7936 RepID=A0A0E9R7X4_ANGAN
MSQAVNSVLKDNIQKPPGYGTVLQPFYPTNAHGLEEREWPGLPQAPQFHMRTWLTSTNIMDW